MYRVSSLKLNRVAHRKTLAAAEALKRQWAGVAGRRWADANIRIEWVA